MSEVFSCFSVFFADYYQPLKVVKRAAVFSFFSYSCCRTLTSDSGAPIPAAEGANNDVDAADLLPMSVIEDLAVASLSLLAYNADTGIADISVFVFVFSSSFSSFFLLNVQAPYAYWGKTHKSPFLEETAGF